MPNWPAPVLYTTQVLPQRSEKGQVIGTERFGTNPSTIIGRHVGAKTNITNLFSVKKQGRPPKDTSYTWWSCHSGMANHVQIVSTTPAPAMGARLPFWGASESCGPTGWLVLLLIKAGDVEQNPGPTNKLKQAWIGDICHRQIQVRKQISIWCNRIEHWVHLRYAGIHLAQYTYTWTSHQHNDID